MRESVRGNQVVYEKLLKELQQVLWKFFRSRTSSEQDTEDLCQSTLLKIHLARATYDPSLPLEPWLFQIARNQLYDHQKSLKRKNRMETRSEDLESLGSSEETVSEELSIGQAFKALTKDQQEAFVMVKVLGLSVEEGAAEAHVSVGAFKVRAHRAYTTFKKAFRP